MPEQDANVLEVLIGKMGKDRDVDAVLRKCACVLGQAEPCEPIGYFLHRRPRPIEFGLVDPLDERFYPIDRLARNRPKRTSEGRSLRTQVLLAEIARSGWLSRGEDKPPPRAADAERGPTGTWISNP